MVTGLEAARFAAPSARVRGLYSRLLSNETWDALLAGDSLPASLSILRDTDYGATIATVEQTGRLSLERLERRLVARAAENTRRAMRLTRGAVRRLIHVWWQHYELENLKAVFRGIDQGLGAQEIERFLVPLGEVGGLPWDALIHEAGVSGLVDRLRDTHYINPLRNAFPLYERNRSLFPLEIALDIRYYRDLAAAIDDLGGADEADARRVFGTWLDILNILWAFRHREYYGLSAEEIVNFTLWRTDRTDANLVRRIALGADPQEIVDEVFGAGRIDVAGTGGPGAPGPREARLPALEMALTRYWWGLARREMGGYPFTLGAILGYLVLEETEARDIVTLLEAKAMGWDPDLIQQHLVRRRE